MRLRHAVISAVVPVVPVGGEAQERADPTASPARRVPVNGSIAPLSDDRLRGVSRSGRRPAARPRPTMPKRSPGCAAPAGHYRDWQPGADHAVRRTSLTVNVNWIDTDITRRGGAYLQPGFSEGRDGSGAIAGGTLPASPTAAF